MHVYTCKMNVLKSILALCYDVTRPAKPMHFSMMILTLLCRGAEPRHTVVRLFVITVNCRSVEKLRTLHIAWLHRKVMVEDFRTQYAFFNGPAIDCMPRAELPRHTVIVLSVRPSVCRLSFTTISRRSLKTKR